MNLLKQIKQITMISNKLIVLVIIIMSTFCCGTVKSYGQKKYDNLYELSQKSATVIIPITNMIDSLDNGNFELKKSFLDSLNSLRKLSNDMDSKYYIDFELLVVDSSTVDKKILDLIHKTYSIINNLKIGNVIFKTNYNITIISLQLKEAYEENDIKLENGLIFEPQRLKVLKNGSVPD